MRSRPPPAVLALVLLAAFVAACADEDAPLPPIVEGDCKPGVVSAAPEALPGTHVEIGTVVAYNTEPPSIGPHWGQWVAWGRYDTVVEPELYVHNLEHGGIALLYDCPDGCPALTDSLEGWARSQPADEGGPFRWVMTPRSGLGTAVAAAAWGWTWTADCFHGAELDAFRADHYRRAPEDIGAEGSASP